MSDPGPEAGERTVEFDHRYRTISEPAFRRAEARVIGSGYSAAGYTTIDQADRLARLLGLGPGKLLVDIGSGAGWPGAYLAASTGCRVVLTDLPLEGLKVASRQLRDDAAAGGAVCARGEALPVRAGIVDAVSSSDAFC